MTLEHAVGRSWLGWVGLIANREGIVAVQFANHADALDRQRRQAFPQARWQAPSRRTRRWLRELFAYLEGRRHRFDLPLQLAGTAFQRAVWRALQRIPYGTTRSYAAVARAVGRPRAVRAVAQACAANLVPLIVPCHRVIRSDGALGGYSAGLWRKQALLALESGQRPDRRAVGRASPPASARISSSRRAAANSAPPTAPARTAHRRRGLRRARRRPA